MEERKMNLTDTKLKRIILLVASGLLTALPLLIPEIGFLQWISLVPMAIFFFDYVAKEKVSLVRMYGYGFLFFMSFYILVWHWFVAMYPLGFIDGMSKPAAAGVVLVAWFGMAVLQSLFGGFAFVCFSIICRGSFIKKHKMLLPLVGGAVWSVYEWTQTIGWWGVPWGRLAIGQTKYLVGLQTASLFGSYFVSFVIVTANFYIAIAICTLVSNGFNKESIKTKALRLSSIAAIGLILFQYGVGTLLWFINKPENKSDETVKMAVIQGNVSLSEQWDIEAAKETEVVYREYTLEAAKRGAEIVLWPETALPYVIEEGNSSYKYISSIAKQAGVTIYAGVLTNEGEDTYNSIVCFYPDGTMSDNVYSKQHLVPFGEFVPFEAFIKAVMPPLADLVTGGNDLTAGKGAKVFYHDECNVASVICFDSIFEDVTLAAVRDGAELLTISTNDSWYEVSAEMFMHNAQAQIRAVESGRYIARAANTGTSTVITNRGEIISQIQPSMKDLMIEDVYVIGDMTLYGYIGNTFVYICFAILSLLAVLGIIPSVKNFRKALTKSKTCDTI